MQDKTTSFDLLVRSLLKDAEEPVPSRVWERVSSHLDRVDARRRALLWWRRAGIAAAAAAAVALGVFFAGTDRNSNQPTILTNNNQLAVAERPAGIITPERDAAATAPQEASLLPGPSGTASRRAAAASRPDKATAVPTEVVSPERMDSFASPGMTETTVPPVETVEKQEEGQQPSFDAEADEAAFRALAREEEAGQTRRTSLSIGGELQTNAHPSASFHGMRRAAQTTPTTGIQEISSQSVYGAPVSFGLGFRYDLNERWSVGTGLTLSILGRSFNGIYTEVDGTLNTVNSTSSDIHNTQYYLGVPVNVYFNIVNQSNLRFYTYAGGTFEKNLLNRYTVSALSNLVYREPVQGIQISAGLGLGVEFMLSRHIGLYVDPSVRYYFNCYQPKSIRTQQPLMLNLEAGFRFNL